MSWQLRMAIYALGAVTAAVTPAAWATRQREALERYELSTLRVWRISKPGADGRRIACIQDAEHFAHLVQLGSYLGKHDGKIVQMSDTARSSRCRVVLSCLFCPGTCLRKGWLQDDVPCPSM